MRVPAPKWLTRERWKRIARAVARLRSRGPRTHDRRFIEAVISHDAVAYRERNVIERFFGRQKQYRRVATRYDKTPLSYVGFAALAAALITLSGFR